MKKLSTSLILMTLALLMFVLVPAPVKTQMWSTPTQLTFNDGWDGTTYISGDGSKIAFLSSADGDYEIFVINSDGSELRQLTSNTAYDWCSSITGNGNKIPFFSDVDGDFEIYVINSDGTGLTQLTSNTADDHYGSINTDGSKIAFRSNVDGDYEIFVINSDGTGLTQLTSNTADETWPYISGDGSKIAFESNVDGDYEIFVINSDGTGLRQLTSNTAYDGYPTVSGDGSKIAFFSNIDGDYEVFVINSDGTGLTQLTSNNAADMWPRMSVDGSKIAFWSTIDGDAEVFVINSDGTALTKLTSNTVDDTWHSINGDGTKIAFNSNRDGDYEIFVVTLDVNSPVTVDDYDGQWHTAAFTITLTATDDLSGVAETYYKINDGSTRSVGADGQPSITTKGANNKLEYWSVDNAGNEELPHKILTGIKLGILPNAYFTSSPSSPIVGDTVSFDASGSSDPDGTIQSYAWNFGDGSTGTGMTPTHSYTSDGTYTVTLTVTDNDGLTDTATEAITVNPKLLSPEASFTSSPASPEEDETVTFDASGSSDPDGTIVNYAWNFGDGSTGSGVTETHAYSSAGTYTVTLTVTDNDDQTDTTTKTITVIEPQLEAPEASFTSSPASPEEDETVTFDASGSSDPDGNIVSYEWNFGDQTTGSGMTTSHAYSTAGTYTVTLKVTDNDGLTDTATKTITVIGPQLVAPDASFTFPSETYVVHQHVTFDASGSSDPDGTIVNYAWNFGDGSTGSGVTATHAYSSAGTFTVTLTVTDNDGYTDTATQSLEVIPDAVKPKAEIDEEVVKDGKTVTFDATKSTDNVDIVSYEWDFGDGTTGTGATPTHVYEEGGTYTVTLTVMDAAGNFDTFILVITVEDPAAGFPLWIPILIFIAIIVGALVWYFLKKGKAEEKGPKPAKINMTMDKTQIMADGKSTAKITIELLDKKGKPVKALEDTEVNLTTTDGRIKSPVVNVPTGKQKGTTILVSSTATGKVMLSATAKGLKRADTTVEFLETARFCMHCGGKMSFTAKYCTECGRSPPAGVDTKVCKNCKAVIPVVANFCAECGASQPKQEE